MAESENIFLPETAIDGANVEWLDYDFVRESNDAKNLRVVPIKPIVDKGTALGLSANFSASPSVMHFGGLVAGVETSHVLQIINISSRSQRLLIIPPSTSFFRLVYEKRGSVAPGIAQTIQVFFKPTEFKYYYDSIRVRGEDQDLLIPIHGYPVVNKVDFPSTISFGNTPLCETVVKTIRLKCSIPVNFSYHIDVTNPHPYYKISPLEGIIPGNGTIEISVSFLPITLGSCACTLVLRVDQMGFVPMPCVVTARAVSGLLESRALKDSESRLIDHVLNRGSEVNERLGKSSFLGSLTVKHDPTTSRLGQTASLSGTLSADTVLLQKTHSKNHFNDPTATMLANTFQAPDLNVTLDKVIRDSKLLAQTEKGKAPNLSAKPRGPGSGAVFDAGSQWIETHHRKAAAKSKTKTSGTAPGGGGLVPVLSEDYIVDGLRIPPFLDSTTAVNFVLTQERGKLKPKDLKAAIERNRADREMRAQEQKRMRSLGAAAGPGVLDLRGMLAEERLNMEEGGPFKRQLRELAFLAEVDEVNKLEIEKGFRVSEEYVGADLLSNEDIATVMKQRNQAAIHKKRADWRVKISRQHTSLHTPTDQVVKSGAPVETAQYAIQNICPKFDSNSNDIWSKRMNTLRRFISLVSRWLVRRRVEQRCSGLKGVLQAAGVTTWEQGREFIAQENATYKSKGTTKPAVPKTPASGIVGEGDAVQPAVFSSVASMVCTKPNPILAQKLRNDAVLASQRFEPTKTMVRRVLFPRFVGDESTTFEALAANPVDSLITFDDRTMFQLKVSPEFIAMDYTGLKDTGVPVSFPPAKERSLRVGAPEEGALRPGSDQALTGLQLLNLPDPIISATSSISTVVLESVANLTPLPDPRHPEIPVPPPTIDERTMSLPDWLLQEPSWTASELDYFVSRPDLRSYFPEPTRVETDVDWHLRPLAKGWLQYDPDESLLTKWRAEGGFTSVCRYLLAGFESRSVDEPAPPGPTLSDYYFPDTDRHRSGLQCFDLDHTRTLTQHDPDIGPLQRKLGRGDVLTDSESDDENVYEAPPPTMEQVRIKLRAAIVEAAPVVVEDPKGKGKGGKSAKPAAKAPAPAPAAAPPETPGTVGTVGSEAFGLGEEIKEDQVELLRDRKTLEMEISTRKLRYASAEAVTARLTELSRASHCLLQALPLQVPFHVYEEKVYNLMESRMPPVLQTYVHGGVAGSTLGVNVSFDGSVGPLSP